MSADTTFTHQLNDGTTVPAIGFGTYPLRGEDGTSALASALDVGYRYLDSAVNYENESEVGEALRRSEIPRAEVRLATKIPGRSQARDKALHSLTESAERFGVETIDVALIHWPNPSVDLYVEAWEALVQAQRDGVVTTIGVSNFSAAHLQRIIDATGVTPAINQIELHPYFPQVELRATNDELGILTQAWSPLGKNPTPFEEAPVVAAAKAHDVTPAQVVLRWHLQIGSMPLPKSASAQRQRENLDVFGFELTEDEVAAITALGRADGRRFGGDPDTHEEM
ncbi:aldo/keto reductase [Knoellia koreensis]|uniref:Aldo/keto reductase n=1 Tax=Knoellia koreensis TaxID=2730921 RepID=A0A849HAQ0_9MICO|nr:aldo/keto reductase [Knoellia sp. DB2414S]NNM44995.1 aldo/keto reductase [Knoellia sp. DB2414S]